MKTVLQYLCYKYDFKTDTSFQLILELRIFFSEGKWETHVPQLAENETSSVERHYETTHPDYDGRYPLKSQRRQEQLTKLLHQATEQANFLSRRNNPTSTANSCCNLSHCKHTSKSHGTIATWWIGQRLLGTIRGDAISWESGCLENCGASAIVTKHMHKACERHCRSLGKYYLEKIREMWGFLSCI